VARIVFRSALAGVLLASLVAPAVTAHSPTQTVAHYPANGTDKYDFGTGASGAWLQNAFNTTASSYWPPGNDRAPTFSYNSSLNSNFVLFVAPNQTGRPDECPSAGGWEACAAYDGADLNQHWDIIVFNNQSEWCQETGFNSGCNDVPRAALHELGHIAGMARGKDNNSHNSSGEAWTVVQTGHAPTYGNTGWDTHQMQPCDVMGLALAYDVYSFSGSYPNCSDGIPNTLDGKLKTKITMATASQVLCVGTAITISGVASVGLDSTNYRQLSGNPLWNRSIHVQRKLSSQPDTSYVTIATVTATSTGGWSRSVSQSAGAYNFRATYDGETALHSQVSPAVTLTWSSAC
jgi:hypothetical protein